MEVEGREAGGQDTHSSLWPRQPAWGFDDAWLQAPAEPSPSVQDFNRDAGTPQSQERIHEPTSPHDRHALPRFMPTTSSYHTARTSRTQQPAAERRIPSPPPPREELGDRAEQIFDESAVDDFDFDAFLDEDPPSSHAQSTSSYGSAFNIDDILNDNPAATADMAPSRRTSRRTSFVDLTETDSPSSPPHRLQPISLKRAAEASTNPSTDSSISKRRRILKDEDTDDEDKDHTIEHLDLTNEEGLAQAQQQLLLTTQQSASSTSGPVSIAKRTCIICMEPYTNATVTKCGHIYCHECLTQALIAGEKNSDKGVGNCPVCRTHLNRKKGHALIPVAFMKKAKFKGKARRMPVAG